MICCLFWAIINFVINNNNNNNNNNIVVVIINCCLFLVVIINFVNYCYFCYYYYYYYYYYLLLFMLVVIIIFLWGSFPSFSHFLFYYRNVTDLFLIPLLVLTMMKLKVTSYAVRILLLFYVLVVHPADVQLLTNSLISFQFTDSHWPSSVRGCR